MVTVRFQGHYYLHNVVLRNHLDKGKLFWGENKTAGSLGPREPSLKFGFRLV